LTASKRAVLHKQWIPACDWLKHLKRFTAVLAETRQFQNCFVLAKTAVKRFSCFSQSQPVSAVYVKL